MNEYLDSILSLVEKEGNEYRWITNSGYHAKITRVGGLFSNEHNTDYGGYWCGYVRVPKTHPAFRKHIESSIFENIEVHNNISYTDWDGWIGFACCDMLDVKPYDARRLIKQGYSEVIIHHKHYWTKEEVIKECEKLSDQLYKLEGLK